MVELLLSAGYAVIFVHRASSAFPFARRLLPPAVMPHEWLRSLGDMAEAQRAASTAFAASESRLLALPFTSVEQYLALLRESCRALAAAGPHAMLCLAAAVSDFYVPAEEMPEHKIQSGGPASGDTASSNSATGPGGLTLHLRPVPKMLGAIKRGGGGGGGNGDGAGEPPWASQAFVVSFKLETNNAILIAKASGAIANYGVDVVCANLLQSYKSEVTLVTAAEAGVAPTVQAAARGDEEEEIGVEGITQTKLCLDGAVAGTEIESLIVDELVARHTDALQRARANEG